jgi:hypothetical protein
MNVPHYHLLDKEHMTPPYVHSEQGRKQRPDTGSGFALSSLPRVVESRIVRAARPFWVSGMMGVP